MTGTTGNILIVGVGGQGTILASDILCAAAMEAGLDAKKSEIHGMSQRGGSVFSHVRFAPKVHSPVIPHGEVDILMALEEMEAARWIDWLVPGGSLIVSGTRILPANVETYPEGIAEELKKRVSSCSYIPAERLLEAAGNEKYVNVFILGAASKEIDFPESAWYSAIERLVPQGTYEPNRAAFIAGRNFF